MKKLKLSLQQLDGVEVLKRSELKNVMGGFGENPTTYSNCAGVSGDVYCCSGANAGTTGDCTALHNGGCTFVTGGPDEC